MIFAYAGDCLRASGATPVVKPVLPRILQRDGINSESELRIEIRFGYEPIPQRSYYVNFGSSITLLKRITKARAQGTEVEESQNANVTSQERQTAEVCQEDRED